MTRASAKKAMPPSLSFPASAAKRREGREPSGASVRERRDSSAMIAHSARRRALNWVPFPRAKARAGDDHWGLAPDQVRGSSERGGALITIVVIPGECREA